MLHHLSNRELDKIMKEHDAILIQPPVDSYGLFNFSVENSRKMINAGENTAREALKKGIRSLKIKEGKRKPLDAPIIKNK